MPCGLFAMNYALLISRVARGIQRDDLVAEYPAFINEALRDLQIRRSWVCMKDDADVTITAGTSSIELPANFKELQNPRESVHLHFQDTQGPRLLPIEVTTRADQLQRVFRLGRDLWMRVFLDLVADQKFIRVAENATEELPFNIRYYGFLPDLTTGTDHNSLTDLYPEMVIARAKAIGLASVNDPLAASMEELTEKRFLEAKTDDGRREISGVTVRMGG